MATRDDSQPGMQEHGSSEPSATEATAPEATVFGADASAHTEHAPVYRETVEQVDVVYRRSPKFGRFITLFGGIGAVIGFSLAMWRPAPPELGLGPLIGYMLLVGVTAGITVGALIAVILDRTVGRRKRVLHAEHIEMRAEESGQPASAEQSAAHGEPREGGAGPRP
ncbi:hypothetical protein [Humidisolicoccus flavus]|uniref:hypothetical protein n=1 Tax=Humidisolicoccus flavus TaxID=3111414 RepID=UPI0032510F8C